jgi:hypothetical protein
VGSAERAEIGSDLDHDLNWRGHRTRGLTDSCFIRNVAQVSVTAPPDDCSSSTRSSGDIAVPKTR